MRVTLKDVALAANVSPATVSKVLNNRYDVAPETVALVEEAIRRVGYKRETAWGGRPASAAHPPFTARAQRLKAATGIALLIPDTRIAFMQSPLTGQLVYGAEASVREQGLNFYLTRFAEDGSLPPCLDPVQVDGLIVRSTREEITEPLPHIPTVWIFKLGYTPYPGDLVQPDNEMVGQMAAEHLLNRGHQHLAVVTARFDHPEARTRAERFVRLANVAGATVFSIESSDMNAIADQLLSQSPRVTGLFMTLGDNLLESFYRVLQKRGVRCGGKGADLEVISCNNDVTYLRLLDPLPANIDIRAEEIGRVAAQTLLWRIQNPHEHRRCVLVEPRLVEPVLTDELL